MDRPELANLNYFGRSELGSAPANAVQYPCQHVDNPDRDPFHRELGGERQTQECRHRRHTAVLQETLEEKGKLRSAAIDATPQCLKSFPLDSDLCNLPKQTSHFLHSKSQSLTPSLGLSSFALELVIDSNSIRDNSIALQLPELKKLLQILREKR
ncbi:hypothetical protein NE237_032822 [Protea cynaroides]|uniref:Uncharacterized protein n=1 Tax=Protea cynaroides TaxID=273540 RepID=A0A9Q0R3G5_9MAGN|nr:hypothetical protein NE237_032822 [Protea cynaroides]